MTIKQSTAPTSCACIPALMRPGTAAKYLDSNTGNLRLLVKAGKVVPVFPYDTTTRMYRKSDLDAFLASLRPGPR